MRNEILNTAFERAGSSHLRIATVAGRSVYTYFYIGNDEQTIQFLSSSFTSGYTAISLQEAKYAINTQEQHGVIADVFFIDVPYDERSLAAFVKAIRTVNPQYGLVPVVYNASCFQQSGSKLRIDLIDDVIDLCNWQYDFTGKISFLKKSKEYSYFPGDNRDKDSDPVLTGKRIFDVVASLLLIVCLLPVFILILLAITLESRGPVFYNGRRAGRGFRIFTFYKFRTMVANADKTIDRMAHLNQYGMEANAARFFKFSNDPRTTRVGKFLRNTSLDELPQLFNVLKGDMSLVGNRPLPIYEAATLTTNETVERFMAPAGITGLWQVKKRGRRAMSSQERVQLDIAYARKSGIFYDLWIMLRTPGALIQRGNV
jgi:lipopolysaccharide/colanic/teichoic acid biosynthesis glycosyltransferase